MSKVETWFAALLRELQRQLTTREFSLWEILLLVALFNAKITPWWLVPVAIVPWCWWHAAAVSRDSDTRAKHGDKGTLGPASGE